MKRSRLLFTGTLAAAMFGGLLATHCGSDTDPAPASSEASGRYRGTFAGEDDLAGTLDVDVAAAAGTQTASLRLLTGSRFNVTGTLVVNVAGIGRVTLSGTFDPAAGTLVMEGSAAGGLVRFEGRYSAGVLSGTATTPWGAGPFSLTNEQLGGLRVFCGKFRGSLRGRWMLFSVGTRAGGVFAATSGERGLLGGTATSSSIDLTVPPSGNARGSLAGDTLTGTWNDGTGRSGDFTASESGCTSLAPREQTPSTDGGTPDATIPDGGPTDATTDAGPTPRLLLLDEITNHSFTQIATNGSFVHYAKAAIPNELWFVRPDGTQKTRIMAGTNVYGLATTARDAFWVTGADLLTMSVLGEPQPRTVATGLAGANELVSDGTSLFVTEYGPQGAVRKLTQGGADGGRYASQSNVRGLSVDATNVYFSTIASGGTYEGRGVFRAPKTMQGTPELVIPDTDYGAATVTVTAMTVEGADLFALVSGDVGGVYRYTILRHAADGSGATSTVTARSAQGQSIGAMAADATHLYVGDYDASAPSGKKARLYRVPRANLAATPEILYEGDQAIGQYGIVTDAANVLFFSTQKVWRWRKTP